MFIVVLFGVFSVGKLFFVNVLIGERLFLVFLNLMIVIINKIMFLIEKWLYKIVVV